MPSWMRTMHRNYKVGGVMILLQVVNHGQNEPTGYINLVVLKWGQIEKGTEWVL